METTKRTKRYYEVGETVYVRNLKRFGEITSLNIDKENGFYKVEIKFNENEPVVTLDIWEINKDKREDFENKRKNYSESHKGINKAFQQVKEFHQAFGHPIAEKPTAVSQERGLNRTIWTGEELVEFLHASSKNEEEFTSLYNKFLVGLENAYKKSLSSEYIQDDTERIVAQADALTDTSYFVNGTFVEMGVLPQQLFDIVQNSNMSKLFTDENGNKYAKYREDGKIQKSPEFFPPEEKLKEEVLRQSKQK